MRICQACGQEIPAGRVEALPNVKYCIKCSDAFTAEVQADDVVAKASVSGRNGFAPKD